MGHDDDSETDLSRTIPLVTRDGIDKSLYDCTSGIAFDVKEPEIFRENQASE